MKKTVYMIAAFCTALIFFSAANVFSKTFEGSLSTANGEIKVARVQEKVFRTGMPREELFGIFPKSDLRTYRVFGDEESLTFNYSPHGRGMITFFLEKGKVRYWRENDRKEAVTSYLGEFCSQYFSENAPMIYEAISKVLNKIPLDVYLGLTDRKYPVIFTEQNTTGSGRIASSSGIIVLEDDPPTFTNGLFIIKLGTELSRAGSFKDIEGVIAHELAHRYLDHAARDKYTLKMEKEADETVISWGFEEELSKSREKFGKETKTSHP